MSTPRLTVGSANLGNHRAPGLSVWAQNRRLRVIAGLQPNLDVLCIQEAQHGLSAAPGYRLVRFAGTASSGPIMIRHSLVEDLRGQESIWVHAGKRGSWAPKWITAIELRGWGCIANAHVISRYDHNGAPYDVHGERWPLAYRYNHALRSWALNNRVHPRIVAGDTNSDLQDDQRFDYPGFPAEQLGSAGLVDVAIVQGTLGRRTVDRLFYDAKLEPVAHGVIPRAEPFDHDHPHATFARTR